MKDFSHTLIGLTELTRRESNVNETEAYRKELLIATYNYVNVASTL